MNSTKSNNLGSESMAFYALIVCNIAAQLFYIVNAVLNQAPLLNFWLPVFALFVFSGYVGVEEYKKLDAQAMTKSSKILKMGVIFLLLLTFLLVMKNWKTSPLGFSDAFILSFSLSNTKDYMVAVLAIRKFAGTSDQK